MVNRDRARFRSGHDRGDTIMLFWGARPCRLTKYGFPRRNMPAARFRQWHFNRRARNSCLHLHRVVSSLSSLRTSSSLCGHPNATRHFALRIYMSRRKRASPAARGVAVDARWIALALIHIGPQAFTSSYRCTGVISLSIFLFSIILIIIMLN